MNNDWVHYLKPLMWVICGLLLGLPAQAQVRETEASPPVRATMAVYDRGFALINELRRVNLSQGENEVRFTQLPARLDSGSVSFTPLAGPGDMDIREQRYAYDLDRVEHLFDRYQGETIAVEKGAQTVEGQLLSVSPEEGDAESGHRPLTLLGADGEVSVFAGRESIGRVIFPDAAGRAFLTPTLLWRVEAREEGPQNLRLSYVAEAITWRASYECVFGEEENVAYLSGRIALANESGGHFDAARVKLVVTEKGETHDPLAGRGAAVEPRLRYAYGITAPVLERQAASAGIMHEYELARPVSMRSGDTVYTQLCSAEKLPVRRFYVYDGVVFDQFPRNRKNDWNYGTEFRRTVETHVEFDNDKNVGLGLDLPPGSFRLYQTRGEETVDLVGEDVFAGAPAGENGHVLLGPARELEGERERTGYSEVTPLHEYEESFEIRLANHSEESVEIRVVEHLYRWPEYEIVRADTEYRETGAQTIEFLPRLKPGGKRSVHYTVRYRW